MSVEMSSAPGASGRVRSDGSDDTFFSSEDVEVAIRSGGAEREEEEGEEDSMRVKVTLAADPTLSLTQTTVPVDALGETRDDALGAHSTHVRFGDDVPVEETAPPPPSESPPDGGEEEKVEGGDVIEGGEGGYQDEGGGDTLRAKRTNYANQSMLSMVGGLGGNVMNRVTDHFSLEMPSSAIRFRHSHVRVFEQANSQFILEERPVRRLGSTVIKASSNAKAGTGGVGNRGLRGGGAGVASTEVTVKYASNATTSLLILRAAYTLIAAFAFGFLLVFCIMILLFLFIDLASRIAESTSRGSNAIGGVSVLLSVPIFVYGLSACMAIAGNFVYDTWHGHTFLRTFGNWSTVITEWFSFCVFLGVPAVTCSITLFAGIDEFWAITLMVWFAIILIFFGFFAACIVFYDVSACLFLVANVEDPFYGEVMADVGGGCCRRVGALARRAILLRQVDRFAGKKQLRYTVGGRLQFATDDCQRGDAVPTSEAMGLYSRMTTLDCCGRLFHTLEEPQRNYTIDEVIGSSPYVTAQSWSLEKIYCRNRQKSRTVAVVNGPSALTKEQVRSSYICSVIGSVLLIILPISLLVWLSFSAWLVIVLLIIMVLCCIPSIRGGRRVYQTYKQLVEEANERQREREARGDTMSRTGSIASEGIYQVWENYRITRPSAVFCFTTFILEILFFFLWPLLFLFGSGNYPMAIFFFFIGIFSCIRHFLNASVVLKELGTFGDLGSRNVFEFNLTKDVHMDTVTDKEWKAKSRISNIIRNVSRGRTRLVFTWFFGILVVAIIAIFLSGVSQGTETTPEEDARNITLLDDFYYEPNPNIPYQTCRMGKGMELPEYEDTALVDYTFISAITYIGENTTQNLLTGWFGEGNVTNNPDVVEEFKNSILDYVNSPAHYKFITVASNPDFGLVSVRGTSNSWDMLTDAQLWGAAALFQGWRAFLPLGGIFTPILHRVVMFVAFLETENINKVSYYREITHFVLWLKAVKGYERIHITGHSLGAGLALISGAQTGSEAVGISAPNALLSRDTFDPPVSKLALNTYTFNVIPNRDIVPMVDDHADLYQRIECRAAANSFLDCHKATRSLCEIMFTCGTLDRPAYCTCTKKYGYPEPIPTGNRTFAEACAE